METHDFGDGAGPVPAHRHPNADGSEGGWVAETAYVAPWTILDSDAEIFGTARVMVDHFSGRMDSGIVVSG